LDGTATYQIRNNAGQVWVVFLNYRGNTTTDSNNLFNDIDSGLWNAAGQVSSWPANDLFPNYPDVPTAATASAPALTTREGVLNGATFDRGIVSGSWIALFGANISGTIRTWTGSDIFNGALPTSLDDVSVTIDGRPAFVYYISPTQINVQAPAGLEPGWVTASVSYHGVTTSKILAHAVLSAPGALTYSSGGKLYAVATTADGRSVIGNVAGTVPAPPGSTVVIYASGLAASQPGVAVPAQFDLTSGTRITIGGMSATVRFSGLVSPGLFQINSVVPTLPDGDQAVTITVNGVSSPGNVYLAVHQ
jgi:uncharacterized protein (TIGR03437 family)